MYRHLKIILFVFIAFMINGCDDSYDSPIPLYPVSMQLNLSTQYPNFKTTNQYLTFTTRRYEVDRVGFGGILVYCGLPDDYGNPAYYAYDMACPYEVKKDIRVKPVTDDIGKVKCEECGSVFDVNSAGIPLSGPANTERKVLRKYKTTLSNDILYIFR